MEILLTFLAEVEYAFNERPKSVIEPLIEDIPMKCSSSLQELSPATDCPEEIIEDGSIGIPFTQTLPGPSSESQHMRSHSFDVYSTNKVHRYRLTSEGKRKDRRFVFMAVVFISYSGLVFFCFFCFLNVFRSSCSYYSIYRLGIPEVLIGVPEVLILIFKSSYQILIFFQIRIFHLMH